MPTLDLDLLRTLSAVQETGTLARASRRVGRTLSAVSLQLKRLESQCGLPLFRRAGRRLELNAEGERVLAVGRRMLSMNDQLLEGLRGMPPVGSMMSDEQVADVINYVRTHFGNSYAGTVSAAEVSTARRRANSAP